jgi:hypothetical protein
VTARQEGRPQLTRGVQRRLGRLAGDEGVVAEGGDLRKEPRCAAGDYRHTLDPLRSSLEDLGLLPGGLFQPAGELVESEGRVEGPPEAPLEHAFELFDAESAREQRVVADLRMGVEGEVVGGERHVAREERLQPSFQLSIDDPRVVLPEEPVMDDE